jgi:hypothetical protein
MSRGIANGTEDRAIFAIILHISRKPVSLLGILFLRGESLLSRLTANS